MLEGLVKNAEIAAKENISSGINLDASSDALHRKLVSLSSEAPGMPLDFLEKTRVVREEHYCVPAFLFDCHGTMSFSYEVGHKEEQIYNTITNGHNGPEVKTKKNTYIVYTPSNGTVNDSLTLFASGNIRLAPQIKRLYTRLDPNRLADVEDLEFPADVETCSFDIPKPRAFKECVEPIMEESLRKKVQSSVASRTYVRGLSLDGSRIEKGEPQRVFLGLYRVVCNYNGREYSMWAAGDGKDAYIEGAPVDSVRLRAYNAFTDNLAKASAPPVKAVGCLLFFLAAVGAFIAWAALANSHGSSDFLIGILCALLAAGFIALYIFLRQKRKVRMANAQSDLDAFNAERRKAAEPFRARKTLRGIYSKGVDDAGSDVPGEQTASEQRPAAYKQTAPPARSETTGTTTASVAKQTQAAARPAEPRFALSLNDIKAIGSADDKTGRPAEPRFALSLNDIKAIGSTDDKTGNPAGHRPALSLDDIGGVGRPKNSITGDRP